jgi:SAM-dependent methyltransferase
MRRSGGSLAIAMPAETAAGIPEVPEDYRLYHDLADWWPLISPPDQYADEAGYLAAVLAAHPAGIRGVLDLGSGGGCVAVHLKQHVALTLVDIAEPMLAVSRRLNPECEHVRGDMRTLRLGRSFDAVLVHDAVDYMTSETQLGQAIDTAFAHCRPGGVALFVPDHIAETFRASSGAGGSSEPSGRQASFQEWAWDPDPDDGWIQVEYEFRLRSADGAVQVLHESHRLAAFSQATWLRLLAAAGFELAADPADISAGSRPASLFVARRPG